MEEGCNSVCIGINVPTSTRKVMFIGRLSALFGISHFIELNWSVLFLKYIKYLVRKHFMEGPCTEQISLCTGSNGS